MNTCCNHKVEKKFFGIEYDPSVHELTSFPADEVYVRPTELVIEDPMRRGMVM